MPAHCRICDVINGANQSKYFNPLFGETRNVSGRETNDDVFNSHILKYISHTYVGLFLKVLFLQTNKSNQTISTNQPSIKTKKTKTKNKKQKNKNKKQTNKQTHIH